MKMSAVTEVIDQYVRESAVDPDKEACIINIDGITNIFSIGSDCALYLMKENETGQKARFDRYKIFENVACFAAQKVGEQNIAVAVISEDNIYIAFTGQPEELKRESFRRMNFDGVLGGIRLIPYSVLMTALGSQVTLFVEFYDDSGFTQQFSAILTENSETGTDYFRLPSEFTKVMGIAAGRAAKQLVDGTYTYGVFHAGNDSPYAGYVTDAPQLIYTPCCNPFGSTLPSPIRLKTEGEIEAICTQRGNDKTKANTHLFAVGGGKLYFYPYQDQLDYIQQQESGKGVPQLAVESSRMLNAKQIASYILADRLYVFIRTAGGELNYTVADYHDNQPGSFFEPVNLMKNVVKFDADDGKLTVLTKDEFIECIHDPVTGSYNMSSITVSTDLDTHICFSAYSTRINVGMANAEVTLESGSGEKIGFYAGNCYYKTKKAVLQSDNMGYVTIVQKADDISADWYTVTCGEETLEVAPAQQVQEKLLSMTSESDFRNAVITDPLGNTTPLVTEDKKSSLAAAAAGMAALRNSAVGLMPGCDNPIMKFENGVVMTIVGKAISILPSSVTENPFTRFAAQVVNDITAGFKWVIDKVKSLYDKTVGKAVTLIVQKTKKVWKFFVQVGGKVIHMVIDCVEKVAAGIKYILEIIGIPVDKIVAFFKKALGLDTAARINTALKNMADWSLDSLIEQISELKETSVGFLSNAIEKIEKMADIDADSLSEIKLTDTTSTGSNVLSAMGISLDSHSMYLYDLIKQAITEEIGLPDISLSGDMETAAGTLLNDIREIEENVERIPASLIYIAEEIEGLVQDFSASALLSVLKKILSVVADDFLHISKTLLKTIFDVVIEGLRAVWKALNTPLQIPFLSDILSAFGIHEFTMIDMVTYPLAFLVGALNSTAKLVSGQEFIDVDALEEFAKADNLKELKQIGGVSYE